MAGSTFAFVLSMGDFLAPQLLGGNDSALMVSNLVWSLFGVAYNWPLGAAVSVIVLLLTLCLLWLANRVETAMNYGGQTAGRPERSGGRVAGARPMTTRAPGEMADLPTASTARPTVRPSDRLVCGWSAPWSSRSSTCRSRW